MLNDEEESQARFDEQRASNYDSQWTKLAPFKDALHLGMQLVLADLRDDARILCVGAGTGAEVLALAQVYPGWKFAIVEPAGSMLAVCRRRVEDAGLTSRCSFHEGYIETLTTGEPFNAATSILVSHFITAYEDRCTFFREIAGRLVSGGYLITADLAADMSMPQFQPLFEVWKRMLAFAGMQQHEIDKYASGLNRDFTVATPKAIESMIESCGFHAPVQYHQTLLIYSWFARRTD